MSAALQFEITPATQFAPVMRDGKVIATLQRRRIYAKGPAWRIFAPDGRELAHCHYTAGVARALARLFP